MRPPQPELEPAPSYELVLQPDPRDQSLDRPVLAPGCCSRTLVIDAWNGQCSRSCNVGRDRGTRADPDVAVSSVPRFG